MLPTRCLPRNEVFFLKRFSGVHLFRKLGDSLLDRPITAFQADKYKKHYTTRSEILTLLSMPLEQAESLCDMVAGLNADPLLREAFQYRKRISQSQLSRDLRQWDVGMFQQILQGVMAHAKTHQMFQDLKHSNLIRDLVDQDLSGVLGKQVVALDSTFKILNPTTYPQLEYGYCTLTKRLEPGLKAHLAHNVTADTPVGLEVTPGNVHDSTRFERLLSWTKAILPPHDVILTYDKGYYKIQRFDEQCQAGYGFVTPLKENSLARAEIFRFEEYSQGRWRVQDLRIRLNGGKRLLRAVFLAEEGGSEEFRLLTNLWEVAPATLKRLYEARWQIEILFRAVKQEFGLKTKRPIGRSLNAVMIQIYCALITYLALSIYRHLVCGNLTVFEVLRQIKYARKRLIGSDSAQEGMELGLFPDFNLPEVN
jgi:hypothetical protein